jgi:microcin C transport system permease protein
MFTLLSILFINFILIRFISTSVLDVVLFNIENQARAEVIVNNSISIDMWQEMYQHFGLNLSPIMAFITLIKQYLLFDFGHSFFMNKSVSVLIKEKLLISTGMGLISLLLIYMVGLWLAIQRILYKNVVFSGFLLVLVVIFYSIPAFIICDIILSTLHINSANNLKYVFAIACSSLSGLLFIFYLGINRIKMEQISTYYICLKILGLKEDKIIYSYSLRNILLVMLGDFPTILVSVMFSSSFFLEMILHIDGIGLLSYNSFLNKDYPVIFGIIYISAAIILVVRLLTDILYKYLNPRLKLYE